MLSTADPRNEIYLSSVSAREIAVKHALGKLLLPEPLGRFVPLQRENSRALSARRNVAVSNRILTVLGHVRLDAD
jgi:PIN domain nuclease of toxin-antitoxin system